MLVDIIALHQKSGSKKPFSFFFGSRGYKMAYEYLKSELQLPDNEVLVRQMPRKGTPSAARVHPLIAVEYLRWVNYEKFAQYALKGSQNG